VPAKADKPAEAPAEEPAAEAPVKKAADQEGTGEGRSRCGARRRSPGQEGRAEEKEDRLILPRRCPGGRRCLKSAAWAGERRAGVDRRPCSPADCILEILFLDEAIATWSSVCASLARRGTLLSKKDVTAEAPPDYRPRIKAQGITAWARIDLTNRRRGRDAADLLRRCS
jgi:hypothetical protein